MKDRLILNEKPFISEKLQKKESLVFPSGSLLSPQLAQRLSRVQSCLQNPESVAPEELEYLRAEFNQLLSELRRRKSVVDQSGQGADFDEVRRGVWAEEFEAFYSSVQK